MNGRLNWARAHPPVPARLAGFAFTSSGAEIKSQQSRLPTVTDTASI